MTKKQKEAKTPEQTLSDVRSWLKAEIKKRKDILNDDFMQSNMYAMDLGFLEIEMDLYKQVLKKLGK
jgi:hypothetical protein